MTDEREMLEAAAKACGFECGVYEHSGDNSDQWFYVWNEDKKTSRWWNPLTNPTDTAEMCAKLEINHEHHSDYIQCLWAPQETYHVITMLKDHDNSRLKAWMFAATMVAAKTQGYEE